jgi:metal-responsive CopG/Arc/MetJ family transcriptional regulator
MQKTVKVTISLPAELLRRADETAHAEQKPRSGVIRDALVSYMRERERQEMIKGYQEMAVLGRRLAEEANEATNEVWPGYA